MDKVNNYLWHSYVPPNVAPEWVWSISPPESDPKRYTSARAARLFDRLFDNLCSRYSGPHLVPISGGCDSRLILAALHERLGPSKVHAVTYGGPGQLDYEIGAHVSRWLGIKHTAIDLTHVTLTWASLEESVLRSPWTYVPNGLFESIAQHTGKAVGARCVWVGFLGDPLTGGHYSGRAQTRDSELLRRSFAKKEHFPDSMMLTPHGYRPDYGEVPTTATSLFTATEWYDFVIRQYACVAPLLLPGGTWDGWNPDQGSNADGLTVIAPFCEREWASYWLGAPRQFHKDQNLYFRMARSKYPELFSLPSKRSYGVPPHRLLNIHVRKLTHEVASRIARRAPWMGVKPTLRNNYLDFDEAFRSRRDYRHVLDYAVDYLTDTSLTPWLDLQRLVKQHERKTHNHARALLTLIGLAVNHSVHESAE